MKKVLAIILVLVMAALPAVCLAKGEKCVKYTIKSTPDLGGWISVKDFAANFEIGNEIKLTVYNEGTEDISCFISAREGEAWKTVGLSDTVDILAGTSEEIVLSTYSEDSAFFLLELRGICEGSAIYIMGDEGANLSKCLSPMSDLINSGMVSVGVIAEMPEAVEATPAPATPTPEEKTDTPTATPEEKNDAPTATVAAAPTIPEKFSTPDVPQTGAESGDSANVWAIVSVALAVLALAEGAVIAFLTVKSKKK